MYLGMSSISYFDILRDERAHAKVFKTSAIHSPSMIKIPDYIGPFAFGVKMGAILQGDDIVEDICKAAKKCDEDGLIDDGDILCVTESVVARAQSNYVSRRDIAEEVRKKLGITEDANLGVLYPIASRNRFVPVLEGFAKAVPNGNITLQFSFPTDCVGNPLASEELDKQLKRDLLEGEISFDELKKIRFYHPATGIDYVALYSHTIEKEGAKPNIFLSNNPRRITKHEPDGIIVSCIHERKRILQKIKEIYDNAITLDDLFNEPNSNAWSEWGLLGCNLHSTQLIKLAPRESPKVAREIQAGIRNKIGKETEVLIYGDGAYKDPSTGIYELADPVCSFGHTDGLARRREGIKYKYFVGMFRSQGKSREEIEKRIEKEKAKSYKIDHDSMEGTTPRKLEDIAASLADLVSGSADAGTPLVVIKNLL